MSDRSRSRSPDRNGDNDRGHSPPRDEENRGNDDHNSQEQNGSGGEDGEGVKLYVGNLDYGMFFERGN